MSLAYKVEELLALRDSVSESAVSIDKFADEDTIKEHVLRPSASASANLTSRESNNSLRLSIVPAIAAAAAGLQKRSSPSPSIKRGKAEKLLKEHGSPPGMRVTAGGRIVPSDLPPLGTSRFGDNVYKPQTIRVPQGNIMSLPPQSNTNTTARIEVISGQPVVFVGDRMFALPALNTNNSRMPSDDGPSMESNMKRTPDPTIMANVASGPSFGPSRTNSQTPFAGLDLPTLKAQQALKKQELRSIEQTEVLQASHRSDSWRAGMVEQKRSLIVELDAIRKQITAFDTENAQSIQSNPFSGQVGAVPVPGSMPPVLPHLQQPLPQAMYAFPPTNPYASMIMYPFPGFPPTDLAAFAPAPAPTTTPHSPGSGSRRSHAVEIKPPREETKKQATSALDPKSPTYEPASKSKSGQGIPPPTPPLPKWSPWPEQNMSGSDKLEHQALSQKPSLSSIDTTDFFPTNTHEHSSTRVAPRAPEANPPSKENMTMPSTPEKHWPASPWNESHSDRSKNHEPAPKLTSWPEAFGKQPSFPSLRQDAAGQLLPAKLERATGGSVNISNPSSSNNKATRTNSGLYTGKEENWPFASAPVAYVPTTYQEGYQAGYNHVGIPDSPEVLQGFVQGILHFLSDESKKRQAESFARDMHLQGIDSRTPSLRALLAGSTPHDSAVSMTFNRNNGAQGMQENMYSAKVHLPTDKLENLAYGPQGNTRGAPILYELCNEGVQEPRQRNVSSITFLNPPEPLPDRMMAGRHVVYPSIEHDTSRKMQGEIGPLGADSSSNGGFSRQFFGNQLQNRGYGTPLSRQRFYPSAMEVIPSKFDGDAGPSARPVADHRLSGLDGAMDDLAEMMNDTNIQDSRPVIDKRSIEAPIPMEMEEKTSSCFKPSSGKGKQKVTCSPAKSAGIGRDDTTSPLTNPPTSPKKSGEHSPAKAKLEQVTNKFRRVKKDDPRTMSPEDRMKRSEKWRQRFQQLKRNEIEEIEAYTKANRT